MISRPRILCLYDKSGCGYWRSWLPSTAMQRNGYAMVEFLELKEANKDTLAKAANNSDILHVFGFMGQKELMIMRQYQALGVKVNVDYDDLHFNCSPWNIKYRHFGLENVEIKDPITGVESFLWKDGENGFSIKDNSLRFHYYKQILMEADSITTTTLYLKEALMEISENKANVYVLPNAIDFSKWKPIPEVREKYTDEFRFGWAVSGSHGEDWISFRSVLLEFLRTHPRAKFVCIGDTYMDIKSGLAEVRDQIEWHCFSDLWEGHYELRMPLLGLDVAVAPLADNEFNKCKSPLKFAEYTAFGWPVIAQNMTPYKEHIIHGETGLLVDSTDGWVSCLNKLYDDVVLRRKLRFNALLSVKEMFDLDNISKEWADCFKQTIGEKSCLR